jgi:hypothetical protein
MSSFDSVNPNLIDVVLPYDTGYPEKFEAIDTVENLRSIGARDFPSHLWIEPRDWPDVARDNDKYGTWPEDYQNRFTNQSPTHECTCHALTQGFEAAWNVERKIQRIQTPEAWKKGAIFVSQISIYAEANPRQWGGASMQGTVGIAIQRGFLPEYHGPMGPNSQKNRFKHTLPGTCGKGNSENSSGSWVAVRNFPNNWKDTSYNLRAIEVINPESWEQIVCLVLHGRVVCVGRRGHAIPYGKWMVGDRVMKYRDSYDVFRYDSISNIKLGVGGSYCIFTVTQPDDYEYPLGRNQEV